ncbi:MAG: hypothetical protein J7501_03965 [Bdellovibrio sp.]|nr:hypothetical protein [Bdellovibrio sp.]
MVPNKGRYKTKYSPSFVALLEQHLKDEWSFCSFGGVIGVSYGTLTNWLKEYPEFRQVKEKFDKVK